MPARRSIAFMLILCLPAFLGASAPATGPQAGEWRMRVSRAARGDALLRHAMLDGHNHVRAELGLPSLAWSEALARAADQSARLIARSGHLGHARQSPDARQGENLFAGTRDFYDYDEMVRMWVDERRDFLNRPSPRFSRTGRWQDASHYAQIVWRDTTAMGCALASGRDEDFLVCRYAPEGKAPGQLPY